MNWQHWHLLETFILSISFPSSVVRVLLSFLVRISGNFGGLIACGPVIRIVERISFPWYALIIFRRWGFRKSKTTSKVATKITFKTFDMFVDPFWDNRWWKAVKLILALFYKCHFSLFIMLMHLACFRTLTWENWIVE